jgi:NAD(P)-dependent dehydrogenase (short-subunit alcohol dehydrogenase family)
MTDYSKPMLREDALVGETILVTGGGTGLGKSMARYFLQLGANVIICSRKEEVVLATAAELAAETGGKTLGLACDVRKYEEIENVIAKGIEKFGSITGLVNNAAGNFISPTERLSHKAFDIIVDIVLKGSYNTTLALGKYWIAQKINGTVMSIVTTYATTGSAFVVPSACAKAGVQALTRSLAVEWAKYGIRLNAIAPGPFPTDGAWSRLFPENIQGKFNFESKIPVRRVGHHQELANLAAYLMSPYSAYVNGEIMVIDGGEWLQGAGEFSFLDVLTKEEWDEVEAVVRRRK